MLIGDISAANITNDAKVDERVRLTLELEDPEITIDLHDKHHYKVGEPGFPIVAVERGKKVIVSKDITFAVADHDFTKMGIISSVIMICNIPESINGDFYEGKIHIRIKDPIFQPSLPFCYVTELYHILLEEKLVEKPVLCLYTDGRSPLHIYLCPALIYLSFHCTRP
ncbi:hypothetical protein GLOIN_2v1880501 [Rhizophagus clarus]|uniref:Uncharacterized protein n=1 Tax=Rhizophagus clarus TaxID=94130 RepID=A0A8H3LCF2_9GLOM|nr:hypothetical protein GLOIN_2v1880501 [Rhizophagus clarus]